MYEIKQYMQNIIFFIAMDLFQVYTEKLEFDQKAESKIGSTDNIDHEAGGGQKKVRIGVSFIPVETVKEMHTYVNVLMGDRFPKRTCSLHASLWFE